MPKIEFVQCDLCNEYQNVEDEIHWSYRISGPIKLDLKNLPGVQACFEYEYLCAHCGHGIKNAIVTKIEEIKKSAIAKKVLFK